MFVPRRITSPDDTALGELCMELARLSGETDHTNAWPAEQLRLCGEAGVFEWFLAEHHGGQGWDDEAVTQGYLALSQACLTTTFVITQRTGACRRIANGENDSLKEKYLSDLVSGQLFATVGISHLTTSHQHLAKPVLTATRVEDGYRLDGFSPWVTGAKEAELVAIGATLVDEEGVTPQQLLVAVPTNLQGVTTPEPFQMVGLTASATGPIRFEKTIVSDDQVIAGPMENIMLSGVGAKPGGHQTVTLALGAAAAGVAVLATEAAKRPDLVEPYEALAAEHAELIADLLAAVRGTPTCSSESLRGRANSLVLRASQAALTATKGAGYLADATAGRLCREALFFLVWSCPQPVQHAGLCELAGIAH